MSDFELALRNLIAKYDLHSISHKVEVMGRLIVELCARCVGREK